MSGSRARAARRQPPRAVAQPRLETGIAPGVCTGDQLAECRRLTHDAVIALAGARRRSGVTWTWWSGPPAVAKLDELAAAQEEHAGRHARDEASIAKMRALLLELGDDGHLVVAAVDVAVPRAFAGPG